jgi:uncharacterized protein YecE (DUF72 family)
MAKSWVGISGWTFPGWKGAFYPKDLVQRKQLEFASHRLNSIEINGTFYSLQKPASFQRWFKEVPEDFLFAVKGPQFITHVLRLKHVEEPLANFFASGLLCLKEKLGPILWQFPPNVMLKDDRFETFLKLLPKDAKSASKLAKQHGPKVEGRAWTKAVGNFPVRHAFEFRHKSFLNPDFLALLRKFNVAFVFAHAGGERAPYTEKPTADFVYARLHGEGKIFSKGYPDREIARWTKKAREWNQAKRDVFIYFSNEAKVYSPAGAMKLIKLLKIETSYGLRAEVEKAARS